jgi:hypothetical protein
MLKKLLGLSPPRAAGQAPGAEGAPDRSATAPDESPPPAPEPLRSADETAGSGVEKETLFAREYQAIEKRFPDLARFLQESGLSIEEKRKAVFELIGICHPPAREAVLRTRLKRLGTDAAKREIAESDLREGIPYSGNIRPFPDIWERALPEIRAHEEAYGAAVFTRTWPSLSRGRALTYYYDNHPPRGRVLHIAPEQELERWARSRNAGFEYRTLGLGRNTDLAEDLTEMRMEDESYDLVICHRVLEHVFDEAAAFAEILRILRPNGWLNVSVPEVMHRPAALEWCYPDATHHDHYRHYGADFESRLSAAGFQVHCEDWLLRQPSERLVSAQVYPLRMYNAHKP